MNREEYKREINTYIDKIFDCFEDNFDIEDHCCYDVMDSIKTWLFNHSNDVVDIGERYNEIINWIKLLDINTEDLYVEGAYNPLSLDHFYHSLINADLDSNITTFYNDLKRLYNLGIKNGDIIVIKTPYYEEGKFIRWWEYQKVIYIGSIVFRVNENGCIENIDGFELYAVYINECDNSQKLVSIKYIC